ncbi:E3 ubiquitin-protein ligase TRIM39-like [Brachyistius frenatus]|uniref:E3 ubiquitin-protein ligase TRIM39-like n=1 Tax=Brachyistius frenatus TaxID=100188 RepID=UPI0037E97A62
MATASSFLSEDQFLCSICLDVFTDPVSIPCGHNFCKACLTRHWEGKERRQCPLCNEKFNKELKLCINTGFREVVENFKTHHETANKVSEVKPGQVPCDCCLANKFRAFKTCLVCLASFCETHLEPHQTVASLKKHKLTDPVQNLEDKICKEHNRISEFFCRSDNTRVCVLCTEHSTHDTVLLEEEYVDKKAQIGTKKAEVLQIKQKRGKKSRKIKVGVQSERKVQDEARENCVVCNQMSDPHVWCFPNEDAYPFSGYSSIAGNNGFAGGRFFYEVQVDGRTDWALGVVSESRHGRRRFKPNPRNENWVARLGNNNCNVPHNIPVLKRRPERVLGFVDYENGLVSFYDAGMAIIIYSFTGCNFNERIFFFFSPCEGVSWTQRILNRLQAMSPVTIWIIVIMFIVLITVLLN